MRPIVFCGGRGARLNAGLLGLVLALGPLGIAPVGAQTAPPLAPPVVAPTATPAPSPPAASPAPATPVPVPVPPAGAPPAGEKGPPVVSVSVSGNAHIPTERILDVVKTKVGQPFDRRTVAEDIAAISDLGFFTDQAPPLIRVRPDGISVTFRVIENPVIQRIVFSGNAHVPSDTLLALMDTAVGQVLNQNTFHQDVLKIDSYYNKIGYGGQLPTHVRDLNIAPNGVLNVDIREGLTVAHIIFKGNPVLPPSTIAPVLALKEGEPYSEETRDKDFERIQKLYEKYELDIGDFEAGIDPGSVDLNKGTADVIYTISALSVGAVLITGNDKTRDEVIRRQLRLRPGMVVTSGLVRRDYERLKNLGFFEKVDIKLKPGPDPKDPAARTLNWDIKEEKTGSASVGAGYSGGPNGTGLSGTVSYSENNIGGTGNGAQLRLERGGRVEQASLSFSLPYVGRTPRSQRYSLAGSLFTQAQTNFYQVYNTSASQFTSNPIICANQFCPDVPGSQPGTTPVVLAPNTSPVTGVVANYNNRSNGLSTTVGRRLNDYLTASLGASLQRVATTVTVPSPFFLSGTQFVALNPNPTQTTPFGSTAGSNSLGIVASSIANTTNGNGYNLRSFSVGLQADTQDDIFNPRRGYKASLVEELSSKGIGSDFNYTITTLDVARFFPIHKQATLGLHALLGASTGAIPGSKVFVLSDQQLRGYTNVFYGTEELLLQSELRIPVTPDRKFGVALFGDFGSLRIRGAQPIVDSFGNVLSNYDQWIYHGDVGVGLRFDVPQLGFKSVRLDFARGKTGNHTSFGIGQSF